MRLVSIVVAGLVLTGCASEEQFRKNVDLWKGKPELVLIQKMGPPDSSYEVGGTKFLKYTKSESGYVAGTAPTYTTTVVGGLAVTQPIGGSSGYGYTNSCSVVYQVTKGVVSGYTYEGNACVATQ